MTQGLVLTVLGMGMVFLFLALLIGFMNLLAKAIPLLRRYFPEAREEEKTGTGNLSRVAAALAVAGKFLKK